MEEAAFDIFVPVVESATVLAAHYANVCARNTVTAEDMRLGMMYAARNVTGKHVGPLYPEVWGEEEGDESEDSVESSDSDQEEEDSHESSSWETVSNPDAPEIGRAHV